MADKLSRSQKWLIQGQIEYLTPFTILWIALLNYCREHPEFEQGNNSDKAIINFLKKDLSFKDAFHRKVLLGLQEPKRDIGLIAKELKRVDIYDSANKRIDFNNLEAEEDGNGNREGIECGDFIFTYSEEDIYIRFLDFVYQMRCYFIHGNLEIDNMSHMKLAKAAYSLLDIILKDMIDID